MSKVPAISKAKSLAASTSKTPTAQVINMPRANTWRQLFEAVIGYGDAILRNPTSQNHRRINTNLGNFKKKISTVPSGMSIVVALGFKEDSNGSMTLPTDVNLNVFRARLIELKAALAGISKFAAKEMIMGKNSRSKDHAKLPSGSKKKILSKTTKPSGKTSKKKGKENKSKTIHHVAQHAKVLKVDVLKQEVLQLKEQLASLAEPRDVDTINRMNPNERKKMEKSAGKIVLI